MVMIEQLKVIYYYLILVIIMYIHGQHHLIHHDLHHQLTPPSSLPTPPSSPLTPNMVSAIIGSLLGGIFLSVGGYFIYKWYKNRQNQNHLNDNKEEKVTPTEGYIHSRNENITNHESASTIVSNYNDEQGVISAYRRFPDG
jgi:hypothetical protein